ncbi:ABC transporter ATP-binding protein [Salinispira pacifica]|uniref:Vitamin B12 ABC transporter, ATPase component BtuD n=1 Tax=Salinispira pacifica TaxID=1307761 RepID=V5WFW2_9SPIO|nr:ABC transporter ATP-binding protein [Salinispira pacifica]AHC14036.1 Vitamin B12 ABC transporter, ATPase component BtuD [Salinispira pacifica]
MVIASKLHYAYADGETHHHKNILNGVDLDIRPGQVLGILGPNGSGKTTLLKNIQLFLKPDQGEITYDGIPHTNIKSGEIAKRVSLVPQKSGGGQSLKVKEMVLLGRIPHIANRWAGFSAHDYQIAKAVMESLDLVKFADRHCHCLSGGEFQKVLLARALCQESGILLLDEATANLDMHHSVEIMELVRKRAANGTTVAAVLHDLNLAAAFCDRVVFMHEGVVFRNGLPGETMTAEVIATVYGIDAYVSRDENGIPFVLPRRNRCNPNASPPTPAAVPGVKIGEIP